MSSLNFIRFERVLVGFLLPVLKNERVAVCDHEFFECDKWCYTQESEQYIYNLALITVMVSLASFVLLFAFSALKSTYYNRKRVLYFMKFYIYNGDVNRKRRCLKLTFNRQLLIYAQIFLYDDFSIV